jgi:hypothetical protein
LFGLYAVQLGFRLVGGWPRFGRLLLNRRGFDSLVGRRFLSATATLPRITATASTSHDRYLVDCLID